MRATTTKTYFLSRNFLVGNFLEEEASMGNEIRKEQIVKITLSSYGLKIVVDEEK